MKLIADSGATKTSWMLLGKRSQKQFQTQGLSPYYFTSEEMVSVIQQELLTQMKVKEITDLHFYGTGCATPALQQIVKKALKKSIMPSGKLEVQSDLTGAARSVCGHEKGIACILGTGSNSCFYNGKKVVKNNPAPGFILGDEGSGAYLGKKVLQHFIYGTFDEELMHKFNEKYKTDYRNILDNVYKKPWPNRYMAGFATFLGENRGHYMVENILEDGFSDFIMTHLYKYIETCSNPVRFCGSIAWHFKDKLQEVCHGYRLQVGNIIQAPIVGLAAFHRD
jgi:glucosamine kinase